MDIETYARIAGLLYGVPEDRWPPVLARQGTTRGAWEAAWERHAKALSHSERAVARYTAAYRAGLEQQAPDAPELTEAGYVATEVARRQGKVLDPEGRSPAELLLAQYRWSDRLQASPRHLARVEAMVQLELARQHGAYRVKPLPAPALAKRVRDRRCPSCNAPKHTQTRTPHVYCDFCGHLMDYDHTAGRMAIHGIDPGFLVAILLEAVREDLRAAYETDDARWVEAWRWVYGQDIAIAPEGWSPRVGQADYRAALIDWSIETCRVANLPEMKRANRAAERALEAARNLNLGQAKRKKQLASLRQHLLAADEAHAVEVRLFEERGLFASHPDALTPEAYRRVHLGGLVDFWRPWLDEERLALVQEHADAGERWMDVPEVPFHRSTCGGCGGKLAVVDGARALLCEGCGVVLDAERPRFPCPSCRAPVVVVPDAHEIGCAHCEAVFVPGG